MLIEVGSSKDETSALGAFVVLDDDMCVCVIASQAVRGSDTGQLHAVCLCSTERMTRLMM